MHWEGGGKEWRVRKAVFQSQIDKTTPCAIKNLNSWTADFGKQQLHNLLGWFIKVEKIAKDRKGISWTFQQHMKTVVHFIISRFIFALPSMGASKQRCIRLHYPCFPSLSMEEKPQWLQYPTKDIDFFPTLNPAISLYSLWRSPMKGTGKNTRLTWI